MNSVEGILEQAVCGEIASGLFRKYSQQTRFDAGLLEAHFYGLQLGIRAGNTDAAMEQLRRASDELSAGQPYLPRVNAEKYRKEINEVCRALQSYAS